MGAGLYTLGPTAVTRGKTKEWPRFERQNPGAMRRRRSPRGRGTLGRAVARHGMVAVHTFSAIQAPLGAVDLFQCFRQGRNTWH